MERAMMPLKLSNLVKAVYGRKNGFGMTNYLLTED